MSTIPTGCRRMARAASALLLAVLAAGCATLGVKTEVVDAAALRGVRSIAIAPVRLQPLPGRNLQALELLARDTAENALQERFEAAGTFARIVRSDALAGVPRGGEAAWLAAARGLGVDALLLVDLELRPPGAPSHQDAAAWRECDARMRVTLVETRGGQLLLRSAHDTYWANLYAQTPDFETGIADAAAGVAGEIARRLARP